MHFPPSTSLNEIIRFQFSRLIDGQVDIESLRSLLMTITYALRNLKTYHDCSNFRNICTLTKSNIFDMAFDKLPFEYCLLFSNRYGNDSKYFAPKSIRDLRKFIADIIIEQLRKFSELTISLALISEHVDEKKFTICIECAEFGHVARYCPHSVCFHCQQMGHMANECKFKS